MNEEPNYHQADIEMVKELERLNTDLGKLPPPTTSPYVKKPSRTTDIVIGVVLIALALIVIFNF